MPPPQLVASYRHTTARFAKAVVLQMVFTLAARAAISVFQLRYATGARLALVLLDIIPARAPMKNIPIQIASHNVVCLGSPLAWVFALT
jgi:hypothetical protein